MNFEITQSNFNLAINQHGITDAIDLWVKYRYADSSTGSLEHVARYQGNYYCSWVAQVKILVWDDFKNRLAHWKTAPCPGGLKHIPCPPAGRVPLRAAEGHFELIDQIQSKKCICPTRALMLSGCKCGGE